MMITTIGLDIAKSVFQVHGVNAGGQVVIRRLEASAMFWRSSRSYHRAWLASRLAELAAQYRLSAIYTTNRPHVDAGV
jgi:transposase